MLPVDTEEKTFAKRNPVTGLIEIISLETFDVVAVQKSPVSLLKQRDEKLMKYTTADGKTVWIEPGIEGSLEKLTGYAYSEVLVDLICEKITEGASLSKICKSPGFPPYSIVARWMRKYPEVKEAIEQARKDRAEVMRDQVLEIMDNAAADSDEIALAKAKADVHKWAAQMDDKQRFGKDENKTVTVSAQIVIDTGIRRPGDPGYRDVTPVIGEKDGED